MAAVQQHLDARSGRAQADGRARWPITPTHIAAAARAKDAKTAGDLIGETDAVCESCHMTYWYPE